MPKDNTKAQQQSTKVHALATEAAASDTVPRILSDCMAGFVKVQLGLAASGLADWVTAIIPLHSPGGSKDMLLQTATIWRNHLGHVSQAMQESMHLMASAQHRLFNIELALASASLQRAWGPWHDPNSASSNRRSTAQVIAFPDRRKIQ